MSKSSGNREIGFLRRVVCGRESFCSHPQRRTRNVALTRATAFGRAADPRKADFSSCGLQALPRIVCAGICGSDWNPRTVRLRLQVAVTLLGMSIPNWAISNEERDADNWLHDLRDHGAGQVLDDFGVEQGTDRSSGGRCHLDQTEAHVR